MTFSYHNSFLFALIAITTACLSLHLSLDFSCFSFKVVCAALHCDFFKGATIPTNVEVQPNCSASLLRVYVLGSDLRSSLSWERASSERRGKDGGVEGRRISGGRSVDLVFVPLLLLLLPLLQALNKGDLLSPTDSGPSIVGGGRCTNVSFPSSNSVTKAFGLSTSGSGALYGGRSAVPGRGRGYLGFEDGFLVFERGRVGRRK